MRPNLDSAIDYAIMAADEINEMLDLELDGLDFEQAASQLARLRYARQLLATLEGSYERHIGKVGPYGVTELVGVGLVTVRRISDRKEWDHAGWKHDVRSQVLHSRELSETLIDASTGEEINAYELMQAVQDVHGAGAPKLTALRALGLDPEDYCTTIKGRHVVQIDTATGATDTTTESQAS